MTLPDWADLSEAEQARLQSIAETFGTQLPGGQMVLPSKSEAWCIALEMFKLSRLTILQHGAQ
jgi:hypothetical protein